MNIQFVFQVEKAGLSFDAGYDRLAALLQALLPVLQGAAWHHLPSGAKESKQPWPAFADREAFLARAQRNHEKALKEWPEYPGGFEALISNASDEREYAKPGQSDLVFSPHEGRIALEVYHPDQAWPGLILAAWAKAIVRAVVLVEWVEFANVDATIVLKRDDKWEETYSIDHRTFPHRQFLGWMGWVQRLPPAKPITAEDLPQAAEVIPMQSRCGSLIVAVGETFDLHNPHHIMQAQKVEMRLVDLDALPVIDPAFM